MNENVLNHVSIAERIPCPMDFSDEQWQGSTGNLSTDFPSRFQRPTNFKVEVSDFNKDSEGLMI